MKALRRTLDTKLQRHRSAPHQVGEGTVPAETCGFAQGPPAAGMGLAVPSKEIESWDREIGVLSDSVDPYLYPFPAKELHLQNCWICTQVSESALANLLHRH